MHREEINGETPRERKTTAATTTYNLPDYVVRIVLRTVENTVNYIHKVTSRMTNRASRPVALL